MNFELFPVSFYVTVILIGIGVAICGQGLRQGWGLPGIVVMLTVAVWYVGDAIYNDYEAYFWEFGRETLENAWWQVALFVLTFLALVKPIHDGMNRSLSGHLSFAMKSYERKLLNEEELQRQIDRVFNVLLPVWLVLMLVALWRVNWDFLGLLTPYFSGRRAVAWERGRVGGQLDALISFAQYLHIFLTAAFGLIWAVSRHQRTRSLAGICFLLSAPYFVLGRARNVMLAVVTPGLLAWVMMRLQTTWLVRGLVIAGAFFVINFWMLFVLENRNMSIVDALNLEESFEKTEQAEHAGLNMFEELGYINHFMKLGTYQPNWGARYFADIVNPIPRGLWPGKPYVGVDYAIVRGMGEGGFAEQFEEGVAATISTGMIGQGLVNFGTLFGPIFAALLMAIWVALLARQDLQAEEHPTRFLLYALGIILTFNMGRDITFIVTYPFFFGYAFVYYMERRRPKGAGVVARNESRVKGRAESGGRRPEGGAAGSRGEKVKSGKVGRWEGGEEMGDPPTHGVTTAGQVAGDGGVVKTLPSRTPKRITRWMPRRVRQQVAAEQWAAADQRTKGLKDEGTEGKSDDVKSKELRVASNGERQRQLGVPFQNYRRYRG